MSGSNIVFDLPMKGYSEGINVLDTPTSMSGDMGNVRPIDSISQRLRIGQRPGLAKAYSTQTASAASPVIWIGSVSVVDYLGD
jgi:hypothetical protein